MLGIVLVAHNDFAESIKRVAEHIVGPLPDVVCISVLPDDDINQKRQEIQKAIRKVNKRKGVVLLTDIFGGTPSNLAISLMEVGKIEVISGMNLPMLVKLLRMRKKTLIEAVQAAEESAKNYIVVASDLLEKKK
ncbi:MAG: PTS sugar transporter subunit IIA [Alphaproteobacteria bacterium]|nr:PTS sugar transporter subunit IIA [Alphaproteobacteria bacterium]